MSETNHVWRLRKRPIGEISNDVLSFAEEAIPEPSDGEFLIRLNYLSLDPTNRIWMSDMDQYMPPVELDDPMRGLVCGTVLKSRHPDYRARALQIPVIIGAQVGETSLLTRAALSLAQTASEVLVAQEGAVGTFLIEEDICEPPMMFSAGGILNIDAFPLKRNSGFGLSLHPTLPFLQDC